MLSFVSLFGLFLYSAGYSQVHCLCVSSLLLFLFAIPEKMNKDKYNSSILPTIVSDGSDMSSYRMISVNVTLQWTPDTLQLRAEPLPKQIFHTGEAMWHEPVCWMPTGLSRSAT